MSDDRPKSCCSCSNVVTSVAKFFARKAGSALAKTILAIVIILQTLPGRPIVFASSTHYYPPGKQKQKNSAEFLWRLPSTRFLHVVQKVRSVQTDFKNLALGGVMVYSMVDGYRRTGVFYCIHLQGSRVRPAPVSLKRESTGEDGKNKIRKKEGYRAGDNRPLRRVAVQSCRNLSKYQRNVLCKSVM